MIEFIASETKKTIFKCCERYAEKNKIDVENVQLVLGLKEMMYEDQVVAANTYTICENSDLQHTSIDDSRKEELDIMQVLGVRIDILGRSRMAPPFIAKSIVRFSNQYEIGIEHVNILCLPVKKNEKGKSDVILYVYNQNDYVDTIEFSDLFREEDFEMPVME